MVPVYLYFITSLPRDECGNTKASCSYLEDVVAGSAVDALVSFPLI